MIARLSHDLTQLMLDASARGLTKRDLQMAADITWSQMRLIMKTTKGEAVAGDKIKVVASAIMQLSYGETMQIANSLANVIIEDDDFDPAEPNDIAELLEGWADNYMECE